MPLADYDTSAEKIAALKCGLIDPSIANLTVSDFTADTTLWVACAGDLVLNGYIIKFRESYGFNYRIHSGDVVGLDGEAMVYVKDNDINYSTPVELYQNRLATILETDAFEFGNGEIFTAGVNGSLLVLVNWVKLLTGQFIADTSYAVQETSILVPIPAGQQLTTDSDMSSMARYFDVPSGW